MNHLIIDDFLIFKHAEITVKPYSVFIGPQASGKSIAAKLLYLFCHFPEFAYASVLNREEKNDLNKKMTDTFRQIFPKETWLGKSFRIKYKTAVGYLTFENQPAVGLTFSCSDFYSQQFSSLSQQYQREIKKEKEDLDGIIFEFIARANIKKIFHDAKWGFINNGGSCTFIPAGRSFFASLRENVFSFLLSDIHIDYFLKEFGSYYEKVKRHYDFFTDMKKKREDLEKIQKLLLKGIFVRKNNLDFIRSGQIGENNDIEIANASSGQQELLPMLLTLQGEKKTFFIIEEPEAHIFPESQDKLIRYIVSRKDPSCREQAFLFTTHSPYVLTALNNLAYAGRIEAILKKQNNVKGLHELESILQACERIPVNSLTAYYFNGGRVIDIIDQETGLINAEKLDKISDATGEIFSQLVGLNLKYENT